MVKHKASLHAIDRFFMMVGKRLEILRVFYNFVEVGRNKQTPARRLGLAKGEITVENIIYCRQKSGLKFSSPQSICPL